MWLIGVLVLLAVGSAVIVLIGWAPRPNPSPPPWDIPALAGPYTGIVGTLAGFSVASAIFVADLNLVSQAPSFAVVVGMFLVSFLILVATAMMFGSTPHVPDDETGGAEHDALVQQLSHMVANVGYSVGIALSWLGLRPLLKSLRLDAPADVFTWLLLTSVLAAAGRIALFLYRLTAANAPACLAIPLVGFGLATIYRLVVVRAVPTLWPADNAALTFAIVAFGVTVVGFVMQSGLLVIQGSSLLRTALRRSGHRVMLAYAQTSITVVALTWFAVALA